MITITMMTMITTITITMITMITITMITITTIIVILTFTMTSGWIDAKVFTENLLSLNDRSQVIQCSAEYGPYCLICASTY